MSDPTKPVGSPFPDGSQPPPQAGSPFPSGPPQGSPFPSGPPQNQYGGYQAPLPADINVKESAGWKWSPLIGITYNGFPVGIVFAIVVGLLVLASK